LRENVQDREISEKKNQTPVRGQDGKISDTRGKDFYWSPTRRSLVGDKKSFLWVSEIFQSCPLTGVRSFISLGGVRNIFFFFFFFIREKESMSSNFIKKKQYLDLKDVHNTIYKI
jgi:hypothetical protein